MIFLLTLLALRKTQISACKTYKLIFISFFFFFFFFFFKSLSSFCFIYAFLQPATSHYDCRGGSLQQHSSL